MKKALPPAGPEEMLKKGDLYSRHRWAWVNGPLRLIDDWVERGTVIARPLRIGRAHPSNRIPPESRST